ncbi:DUF2987 domain-containing protein [Vibrio sp. ZSDZ34]|uniref:DUF2987 domain-containing protein n=1 Tax=Vibrio gelatinilyticus TaxID=2893468 RepID=A0A9X1WHD3_9VIBR|nr:DUF2987 domain-containing protein [Vibrio gelatinilyticus]MCJ2376589.1 DUF2987 domain-containing protein [Vibrio gelatinilyticus]
MKAVKVALLGLSLAATSIAVNAQEYRFTYSKLYSQMKNNAKEGHEEVKVGFFFVDALSQQLCPIEKAWMEKEEHYEKLKSSQYNELLIPLDKNLKSANPLVFVHTPKDRQCDFSMVVMTKKPLQGEVNFEDVERLLPQMQVMLEDLGGMFASWFTPTVEGLTLEFDGLKEGSINLSNGKVIDIYGGKAQVLLSEIGEGGSMTLPRKTSRVLPYIPAE